MIETNKVATQLNKSTILYQLSEYEAQKLKECLLSMLNDLIVVCDKFNLCYMLCGGSALGAVRHKGFIPWDDDLDVMMPRKDYNRLIEVFEKELSNKYYMHVPNSKYNVTNNFMKIIKKGTYLEDIYDVSADYEKGIFLDIFPIENAPANRFFRKIKGFISDVIAYIGASQYMYTYQNEVIKKYFEQSKHAKRNYKFRIFIGFLFGFFTYKTWHNIFDKFVQIKKNTGVCTVPTGRKHYFGESLDEKAFFPTTKGKFENLNVELPGDVDSYLKNLYGDYMKIPPLEKRERHYFLKIKFDD